MMSQRGSARKWYIAQPNGGPASHENIIETIFDLMHKICPCAYSHKSPGTDQIPAELIKEGVRTIRCAIHKFIISIWNKEDLPEEWKESFIVPIYIKGDKTDCNNYRGISLLPTTYKILSTILLSRLIPYAQEVIGDH
jgi:hypothetical protein